jgi:aquaporin Z
MLQSLKRHWPEYAMEAAGLGTFMISAGIFGTSLEYPGSPIPQAIADPFLRRAFMGVAMGLTAIGIIYSPWGKQSGAHINPAVTLTFFRLGKIEPWDALFYVVAQFAGGIAGVLLVAFALGHAFADPPVNYVTTLPGSAGPIIAFLVEAAISFVLMFVVLLTTNTEPLARRTGLFAGILVATYITLVAPLSGMSMNPARTLGSALPARLWESLWIYFTAPPIGMLLAAETYLRSIGPRGAICAKLHHDNDKRCIFRCGYGNVRG